MKGVESHTEFIENLKVTNLLVLALVCLVKTRVHQLVHLTVFQFSHLSPVPRVSAPSSEPCNFVHALTYCSSHFVLRAVPLLTIVRLCVHLVSKIRVMKVFKSTKNSSH
jgi:hypothetical protein